MPPTSQPFLSSRTGEKGERGRNETKRTRKGEREAVGEWNGKRWARKKEEEEEEEEDSGRSRGPCFDGPELCIVKRGVNEANGRIRHILQQPSFSFLLLDRTDFVNHESIPLTNIGIVSRRWWNSALLSRTRDTQSCWVVLSDFERERIVINNNCIILVIVEMSKQSREREREGRFILENKHLSDVCKSMLCRFSTSKLLIFLYVNIEKLFHRNDSCFLDVQPLHHP